MLSSGCFLDHQVHRALDGYTYFVRISIYVAVGEKLLIFAGTLFFQLLARGREHVFVDKLLACVRPIELDGKSSRHQSENGADTKDGDKACPRLGLIERMRMVYVDFF